MIREVAAIDATPGACSPGSVTDPANGQVAGTGIATIEGNGA